MYKCAPLSKYPKTFGQPNSHTKTYTHLKTYIHLKNKRTSATRSAQPIFIWIYRFFSFQFSIHMSVCVVCIYVESSKVQKHFMFIWLCVLEIQKHSYSTYAYSLLNSATYLRTHTVTNPSIILEHDEMKYDVSNFVSSSILFVTVKNNRNFKCKISECVFCYFIFFKYFSLKILCRFNSILKCLFITFDLRDMQHVYTSQRQF